MEIVNHKEEIPFSYYEGLFRQMNPEDAVMRLGNIWDGNVFHLELLGTHYTIPHPDCAVTPTAPLPAQTFLLRYLLEGKAAENHGQWLTFREMPWGELYIKPYTGRVLTRAAFTFGTRLQAFKAAAEKLGGVPVGHGDAGYQFSFIGEYAMQILVWEGDDEFPPNAQVLYSDNFASGFAAEDRVVAGDLLISAIKANM